MISPNDGALTNREVLNVLAEQLKTMPGAISTLTPSQLRRKVLWEGITHYCNSYTAVARSDISQLSDCFKKLKENFTLTETEALQLVNVAPSTPQHAWLLLASEGESGDFNTRFSEDDINAMIDLVASSFSPETALSQSPTIEQDEAPVEND